MVLKRLSREMNNSFKPVIKSVSHDRESARGWSSQRCTLKIQAGDVYLSDPNKSPEREIKISHTHALRAKRAFVII